MGRITLSVDPDQFMNIVNQIPLFVILVFSIIFHEVAHGLVALWRGDTTARDLGRLTFNPLPHVDLFGTILFPLFLILTRAGFLFGWAKPVPVDPRRFRNGRQDMALVAAAGPVSNVLLALLLGLVLKMMAGMGSGNELLVRTLGFGITINLVLAAFNLLPLPPLDGSRIVMAVLPRELLKYYVQLERYGMFIIFIGFALGLTHLWIRPVYQLLASLLTAILQL